MSLGPRWSIWGDYLRDERDRRWWVRLGDRLRAMAWRGFGGGSFGAIGDGAAWLSWL